MSNLGNVETEHRDHPPESIPEISPAIPAQMGIYIELASRIDSEELRSKL